MLVKSLQEYTALMLPREIECNHCVNLFRNKHMFVIPVYFIGSGPLFMEGHLVQVFLLSFFSAKEVTDINVQNIILKSVRIIRQFWSPET